MPDVVAVMLVTALAVERVIAEYLHARERRYLVNAAIAKTPGELRMLDKPEKRRKVAELPDGYDGQVGA